MERFDGVIDVPGLIDGGIDELVDGNVLTDGLIAG